MKLEYCYNCGATFSAGMMHDCPPPAGHDELDELIELLKTDILYSSDGVIETYQWEEAKAAIAALVARREAALLERLKSKAGWYQGLPENVEDTLVPISAIDAELAALTTEATQSEKGADHE